MTTIRVGYTTERPIIPDQFYTNVTVGETGWEASLIAAQMVAARRGVEMVTSTKVLTGPHGL